MDTIKELSNKLSKKQISSEELVKNSIEKIKATNKTLNAVLDIDESAIDEAKQIDQKRQDQELSPLAGIPVILKDNILVEGWKNSACSRILENHHSAYDSTVAYRLKDAGAILIGNSNMDEFAMGSSNESSHFGPVKNPWNPEYVPGGSSGGSTAAVAADYTPLALGSDTGGSIRQPASLCGVTGLKPTYGRVSRYGLMAMASSLDQIGTITNTVEDAAIVMQTIEGGDTKDATSSPNLEAIIPELIEKDVTGLKIGIPKEYFVKGIDNEVKTLVMHAINRLEEGGAHVKEISLPHAELALETYYVIMQAEASSNLARYDGMRFGYSTTAENLLETYKETRGHGFGEEVKRRIMLGTFVLSTGYFDAFYRKALQVRSLIKRDLDEAFKDVDLIVSPTSPTTAWKLGEKVDDPVTMYLSDIYTVSANLATIPALSIPCGFSNDLPVGLQFMARPFEEYQLYKAGMYYQSATDWHTKKPKLNF